MERRDGKAAEELGNETTIEQKLSLTTCALQRFLLGSADRAALPKNKPQPRRKRGCEIHLPRHSKAGDDPRGKAQQFQPALSCSFIYRWLSLPAVGRCLPCASPQERGTVNKRETEAWRLTPGSPNAP